MKQRLILPVLLLALTLALSGRSQAQSDMTVVELFTSQGCSSCPPAEAYLGELAARDDVVALELHVDYWDYIGWKDRFAQSAFTDRQKAYSRKLGSRYVYTPQMVIGGATHVVGSDRVAVENALVAQRRARADDGNGPKITMTHGADAIEIVIDGEAEGTFDVMIAAFDRRHETKVTRGENAGRNLTNSNVVRSLERIGGWSGGTMTLTVPLDDVMARGGCAVLLQAPDHGPIIAATSLTLDHEG